MSRSIQKKNIYQLVNRFFEKKKQESIFKHWQKKEREVQSIQPTFSYNPLISIVLPVYNVDVIYLKECIDSVIKQKYPNWELCIADDASTFKNIKTTLEYYRKLDIRIKVVFREENGHICQATNSALKMAKGEFVVFLDNDDILSEYALISAVEELNKNKSYDFLYSDEDKIVNGNRTDPAFKPSWSPQLILSTNYTSHLGMYRRSIIKQIGEFSDEYIGSQDYDFTLKFIEQIDFKNICHIPKILYHWRVIPSSTSNKVNAKSYTHEAGKKALEAAVKRKGINAVVRDGFASGFYDIQYHVNSNIKLTVYYWILDFSKNIFKELEKLIVSCSDFSCEYSVFIPQKNKIFMEYILELKSKFKGKNINIIVYGPTTGTKQLNQEISLTKSEYLLFLTSDVLLPSQPWLLKFLGICQQKNVASVSSSVISRQNKFLSSGWYQDSNNTIKPFYHNYSIFSKGYFGRLKIPTNVSIGEPNAFLIKREIFQQVNGYNENMDYFNAVIDFYLKLTKANYSNVCIPYIHFSTINEYFYNNPHFTFANNISFFKTIDVTDTTDPYRNNEFPLLRK